MTIEHRAARFAMIAAIALVAALGLAACGAPAGAAGGPGGGASPGPQLGDALRGREFLSTAVTQAGAPRRLVPGTRIRLAFTAQGVVVQAGCSTMGNVSVEGDHVVVGDGGLAGTAIGCDPARGEQDAWLGGILTSRPTLRLDGNTLVLTSGTTRITLSDRRVAEPDLPLEGTRWLLDGVTEGDTAASVPAGVTATLRIVNGQATIVTGCRSVAAPVRVTPGTLEVGPHAVTRPRCTPDREALERTLLGVFAREVRYSIEADGLRITGPTATLTYRAEH